MSRKKVVSKKIVHVEANNHEADLTLTLHGRGGKRWVSIEGQYKMKEDGEKK